MDKKIFLCVIGPYEQRAWSTLWTEDETRASVRDFLLGLVPSEVIGLLDQPFKKLRVERLKGDQDDDGRIYIWGEDEPGVDHIDLTHEGTCIWLDGKIIYNDLQPSESERLEGHDEECEDC